jgi:gluconate 5-dehydrogenase
MFPVREEHLQSNGPAEWSGGVNAFSLAGQTALVTGGSRGIGLGIARALAISGARIILAARRFDPESPSLRELAALAPELSYFAFDLSHTEAIEPWFRKLCGQSNRPDILVNAAGMTVRGETNAFSLSDWHNILALNATAVFELSRCFARELIAEQLPGRIINIASLMTAAARSGTAAYTASKGALGQLTKALAVEWASRGILVNAVAPGYIATDLTRELAQDPKFDARVQQRCPLGRWGTAEDIAWPVAFLASPAASFITGQILFVDGGWLSTF